MNPFWLMTRVAGMALLTAAGLSLAFRELRPKSPDLMSGLLHFRKGCDEFQKGFSAVFFGSSTDETRRSAETRESSRIPIE